MEREVLPARTPFRLRTLLLCGLLSACTAHTIARNATPAPTYKVPLSVWHTVDLDNDGHACEPYFLRPALLCLSGPAPEYDGCSWTCSRWSELQQ